MHGSQEDHLIVLHGSREVELYWPPYRRVEKFRISADKIEKDGVTVHECNLAKRLRVDPATLAGWERTEHIPSNEIRNKLMSIIKKN